jgi:hypothetical protein
MTNLLLNFPELNPSDFEHFGLLIAWNGASGGSYMVKKFTEMRKPVITPEEEPTPVPTELLTGRAE